MFDRYTPHPFHQVIPFLFVLISAAILGAFPSLPMATAFVAILLISLRTSIWIARVGEKREDTEFWNNLGYDLEQLRKSRPEVWEAMGFIKPPDEVVMYKETTGEESKSPILEMEKRTFGLSGSELNYMANELLASKRTLAETEWVNTPIGSTRMRSIKVEMEKAKLIAYVNPSAKTQGMIITEDGVRYFKRYASSWALHRYEEKGINTMKNKGDEDLYDLQASET